MKIDVDDLFKQLAKIEGGYTYSGACSYQICFPLKSGGELRFMVLDDDVAKDEGVPEFGIDLYDGALPPMITGFGQATGGE